MQLTFVSISAASEIMGPDKHLNISQVEKLSTRLQKAAATFAKKVEKQDPATMQALTKAGAKTPKQVEKAISPIGYLYVPVSAKPVPYSAAKEKAKNTVYLKARSVAVYQRTRPSANAKHKLICVMYSKAVVGAELFKQQQTVLSSVTKHKAQKDKTATVIKKVRADNMAAVQAGFKTASESLKSALAGKVKDSQITEIQSMTGAPSIYLKFGSQVVVVRPATVTQLNKAKAAAEQRQAAQ